MFEGRNMIEVLKLLASFSTPIVVAIVGYFLNKRLKSIDDAQWQNRKIIEKRLSIYDDLAPRINRIYCFSRFVGSWKDTSPPDVLVAKRELDRIVHIYVHLLSEDFQRKYSDFIRVIFQTYTGYGKDALIRVAISSAWGDRREHNNYVWDEKYLEMFVGVESIANDAEIDTKYLAVMHSLRDCIGIVDAHALKSPQTHSSNIEV